MLGEAYDCELPAYEPAQHQFLSCSLTRGEEGLCEATLAKQRGLRGIGK